MGGLSYDLTLFTTFVCLGLCLWFSIYLLSRSRANPLAFRAIIALVAMAFYYMYVLNTLVSGAAENTSIRWLAITIALIAIHDLTYYLLDPEQRRKRYAVARGIVLLGLIDIIVIFSTPSTPPCDPTMVCPTLMLPQTLVIYLFNAIIFFSIVYNLWLVRKSEGLLKNMMFLLAILIGIASITLSFFGTILNLPIPRLLPNLLILASVILLAVSVARDRTFVTHRQSTYDLPVTLLTITAIVIIYILAGRQLGMTGIGLFLLAVLAVFSHSAYDFVRDFLDQLFHRQERQMMRELDTLGREINTNESMQRYFSRGLAILCQNLNASRGFIAVRQDGQYTIVASLHSLPVGKPFPSNEVTLEGYAKPASALFPNITWLAPGHAGGEQVVVIGIGPRKDNGAYEEEDLFWLEDIAQEIGRIVRLNHLPEAAPVETHAGHAEHSLSSRQILEQAGLLSALAYKPDMELVECIEDGYQHINDYDALGKSPLVELLDIEGSDHLECGKKVHDRLIQILEKLRPPGQIPPEPLPREWHAYIILYDSYVRDCPSRDIMGKLYIGEGTYYRVRRQALRGISRVVLEMGATS